MLAGVIGAVWFTMRGRSKAAKEKDDEPKLNPMNSARSEVERMNKRVEELTKKFGGISNLARNTN
jgi:ribosomal protein S2